MCDCQQFPCEHTPFARRLGMGALGRRVTGPEVEFSPAERKRLTDLLDEFDRARRAAWIGARDYIIGASGNRE